MPRCDLGRHIAAAVGCSLLPPPATPRSWLMPLMQCTSRTLPLCRRLRARRILWRRQWWRWAGSGRCRAALWRRRAGRQALPALPPRRRPMSWVRFPSLTAALRLCNQQQCHSLTLPDGGPYTPHILMVGTSSHASVARQNSTWSTPVVNVYRKTNFCLTCCRPGAAVPGEAEAVGVAGGAGGLGARARPRRPGLRHRRRRAVLRDGGCSSPPAATWSPPASPARCAAERPADGREPSSEPLSPASCGCHTYVHHAVHQTTQRADVMLLSADCSAATWSAARCEIHVRLQRGLTMGCPRVRRAR
jgi:hypothetical protein